MYSADIKQDRSRLIFVFVALAVGFAFRGPVGLVGPTVVVASYYASSRQWRKLVVFLLLAGLTGMAGVALLTWAAYVQGGKAFMLDVVMMQGLGRVANAHAPRYYFYFSIGLMTYGVTVFFALNVIIKNAKQWFQSPRPPAIDLLFYLTLWVLALLVLFTIPNSKKLRYIMSITPAIALLAAYTFVDREGTLARARQGFLQFCLNLPLIGLALLLMVFVYDLYAVTPLRPDYPAVLISCSVLALGRYWAHRRYTEHAYREFIVVLFGLAAFLSLDAFFFDSISYHLELSVEPTPKFLPYWFW